MEHLPWYIYAVFGVTVLLSAWLFSKATHYSKTFLLILTVWVLLQSILSISGFYSNAGLMTKRFPLLVLPPLLLLISCFITPKGRLFIDGLNIRALTIFHVVRILVEIVLFWLFVHTAIPQAMTFEGRNFDILAGLTAPLVYYFGFVKKKTGRGVLLAWNIACIVLLVNVVSAAVLSLPDRYQQFGFLHPNIALGYFPFVLLPACIVPMALFAHLAAVRQLMVKKNIAVL